MRPTVLNRRDDNIPEGAVHVSRPSRWGNPFACVKARRATLVEPHEVFPRYVESLLGRGDLEELLEPLRGKALVCWCAPLACHAHILVWLANRPAAADPYALLRSLSDRLAAVADDAEAQARIILSLSRKKGRGLMKALSVKPEPAHKILAGTKQREYRSRPPKHRGPLVIHSCKPDGFLICLVDVIDCVWDDRNECWAWVLANPRSLERVQIKGQVGLWTVPDDLVRVLSD